MKNQFHLNIKTPCQEHFNQFTPTAKGGFCNSCEKEVIDFTKMNAQETIHYFKTQRKQNTCGRFNSSQLRTYTQNNQQRKGISIFSAIGLALLSFLSIENVQSQEKNTKPKNNKNTLEIKAISAQESITIKGTVTEDSMELPGVSVVLQGTLIGTQTDFDGNFKFPKKLKKGDVLVFSYVGMQSQKIVIGNENTTSKIELKVNMTMDSCILMGKVAIKEVYKSNKK